MTEHHCLCIEHEKVYLAIDLLYGVLSCHAVLMLMMLSVECFYATYFNANRVVACVSIMRENTVLFICHKFIKQ